MATNVVSKPATVSTAVNIAELYNKLESEAVRKNVKRTGKKFTAGDIRANIVKIFSELQVPNVRMAVLVQLIKTDQKFGGLRYQEVRSVVKGKGFKGYELVMVDEVSMVKKL